MVIVHTTESDKVACHGVKVRDIWLPGLVRLCGVQLDGEGSSVRPVAGHRVTVKV